MELKANLSLFSSVKALPSFLEIILILVVVENWTLAANKNFNSGEANMRVVKRRQKKNSFVIRVQLTIKYEWTGLGNGWENWQTRRSEISYSWNYSRQFTFFRHFPFSFSEIFYSFIISLFELKISLIGRRRAKIIFQSFFIGVMRQVWPQCERACEAKRSR